MSRVLILVDQSGQVVGQSQTFRESLGSPSGNWRNSLNSEFDSRSEAVMQRLGRAVRRSQGSTAVQMQTHRPPRDHRLIAPIGRGWCSLTPRDLSGGARPK